MRFFLANAFIILFTFVAALSSQAQWTLSGSNVYPTQTTYNVGIGNSAPGTGFKLDVTGDTRSGRFASSTFSPLLQDNFTYDSKTTYNYGLSWVSDSWNTGGYTAWLSGWSGIRFFTNSTPRLSIASSGYTGIGITNPGAMLHIKGTFSDAHVTLETNNGLAKWQLVSLQSTNNFALSDALSNTTPFTVYKGAPNNALLITNNGSILINQTTVVTPGAYKLEIGGAARANKVVVNTTGADFVFDSSYSLLPLSSVEDSIKLNKHLPDIQSAIEMQKDGLDLGENQTKLLQKIEELTLYLIEQKKQIENLHKEIIQLQKR